MCTYGTSVTTITSLKNQARQHSTATRQHNHSSTTARKQPDSSSSTHQRTTAPTLFFECDSCHDTVTDSADNRFVMWELSGLRYKHKVVFTIVLLLFVMWELSGIRFKHELLFDLVMLWLPTQRIAAS